MVRQPRLGLGLLPLKHLGGALGISFSVAVAQLRLCRACGFSSASRSPGTQRKNTVWGIWGFHPSFQLHAACRQTCRRADSWLGGKMGGRSDRQTRKARVHERTVKAWPSRGKCFGRAGSRWCGRWQRACFQVFCPRDRPLRRASLSRLRFVVACRHARLRAPNSPLRSFSSPLGRPVWFAEMSSSCRSRLGKAARLFPLFMSSATGVRL
jgi:hypothetical protein